MAQRHVSGFGKERQGAWRGGTEWVMERVSGFEVRALIGHLDEEGL